MASMETYLRNLRFNINFLARFKNGFATRQIMHNLRSVQTDLSVRRSGFFPFFFSVELTDSATPPGINYISYDNKSLRVVINFKISV